MSVVDDRIQELVNLISQSSGEAPGPVVRWSLVVQVLQDDQEHLTAFTRHSDNMMAWELRGHAWLLEKDAEDALNTKY